MTGGRALVLGPTGRNFAAGMSGGIAYVYDPEGGFPERCNLGMVDLEGLTSDADEIKELLQRHVHYTGSTLGERLLADWDRTRAHITRVMPREFKKVLASARYDSEFGALATGP